MAGRAETTPDTPISRDEFSALGGLAYLNHAGISPLPASCVAAVGEYLDHAASHGSVDLQARLDRMEAVREGAARFLGVPPTSVAFVKNTTEGLGFVASGLAWNEGDRVVVPGREFPSTLFPWLALRDRGVHVDVLDPVGETWALPLELFEAALRGGGVKVVALSWVQFGRGWRTDLAVLGALCRDHGALLCVDAIQGLGLLPVDLRGWGVDFAVADAHKWLLGPEGIGLLYVDPARLDLLRPLEPGWNSVSHRGEWDNLELIWDESARRLEGGSLNAAGVYGLGASVELLARAGVDVIWNHVDGLCARAAAGLAAAGAEVLSDRGEGRSGIVTFRIRGEGDQAGLVRSLRQRGFVTAPRGGGVRLSPHAWCSADEIDAFVDAVTALAS